MSTLRAHTATVSRLADLYKQLDAAVGQFGLDNLKVSTRAIESNAPGDARYQRLEGQLSQLGAERDALVARMNRLLQGAEFQGQTIGVTQANDLLAQGNALLNPMAALAGQHGA